MSDPGTCSDAVSLGGTGQEAEADGDPSYTEPTAPCTPEETQPVAKQPPLGEGMEVDFDRPDTCPETLTAVDEAQDAAGISDKGDFIGLLRPSV